MSSEEKLEQLETETLEAKKLFSVDYVLSPPKICGSRMIVAVKGKVYGPMLNGTLVEPTSDWLHIKPNGFYNPDVNIVLPDLNCVIETDDGEYIYMHIVGTSKRREDPTKSEIRSSASFETSAEKYKFLNEKMLVGRGQKDGPNITMSYFDIV